jgi:hypothetical protein
MRHGAFAMFDALGFKGIWARAQKADPPWDVLGKLEKLVTEANDVRGAIEEGVASIEQSGELKNAQVRTLFLSDTIMVGAWADDPTGTAPGNPEWAALTAVAHIAASLLSRAANAPDPRLVYRGCISVGEFDIRPPFVVGPAVDEAAELANSAEAALVWLAPSAKRVIDSAVSHEELDVLRSWQVPLKSGQRFSTYVVSPYSGVTEQSWVDLRLAIRLALSSPQFDVQIKAQNTTEFLDHELARLRAKVT